MSGPNTRRKRGADEIAVEKPVLSDAFDFDDGDVIVKSSDNVVFKVHKFRLQAASSVFQSMFKDAQPGSSDTPLQLTDVHLETSRHLDVFFDLIYNGNWPEISISRRSDIFLNVSLWKFLSKYDCVILMKWYEERLVLQANSEDQYQLATLCILGAMMEREKVCFWAIRRGWNSVDGWLEGHKTGTAGDWCTVGERRWDWTALPLRTFQMIPVAFQRAYIRACSPETRADGLMAHREPVAIADRFIMFMRAS